MVYLDGEDQTSSGEHKLRVLYVHHAGPFGGASRSLFELIRNFPPNTVDVKVVTRKGQFLNLLNQAGIDAIGSSGISQFDNTKYSHYRGARWIVLFREIVYLPTTFFSLLTARRRWTDIDLVHVNDITLIPVIWLARWLFPCPVVVHIRSVQHPFAGWRGKILRSILVRSVDRFIAIDQTVLRSVDEALSPVVVHNGLSVEPSTFETIIKKDDVFTIGMVGGLSRSKGCVEFVQAAKICRDQGARIRFVFIGQSMRPTSAFRDAVLRRLGLSQEIEPELRAMLSSLSLKSSVEFWPFTFDLAQVYGRMDVLCVPSHYDAPGRPIFEAALFGVPSIAAITQPTPDTIVHGVTGITIRPRSAEQLAQAIFKLANDPKGCREMGQNARKLAFENFDIQANALRILHLYRALKPLQ